MANSKVLRRAKIKEESERMYSGTSAMPRLSVFRSNKQIYAQIIDDLTGTTLVSSSSLQNEEAAKGNKIDQASVVGKEA
jgi:large subunit ribosomal protein L18